MRLVKLIVPAALVAVIALFAPHADAQTMGEYATATAGVANGASSMGASIANTVSSDNLGGGSTTWGASSVGGSFEERAGAASSSGMGADFESRAGSSTADSRWPGSGSSADGAHLFKGKGPPPCPGVAGEATIRRGISLGSMGTLRDILSAFS